MGNVHRLNNLWILIYCCIKNKGITYIIHTVYSYKKGMAYNCILYFSIYLYWKFLIIQIKIKNKLLIYNEIHNHHNFES